MIKKHLTIIFGLILSLNVFSQNNFVKGYFIDNSNNKVNCQIKNEDWLNNPKEFKYKTDLNSEVKTLTINKVKEFGVLNIFKFERHLVDIDRSSDRIEELDSDKNPIFNKETLFLKVLVEGSANLYFYEDKGLVRYFFNKDLDKVRQLISKHYLLDAGGFAVNNRFRGQLWSALKCEDISMNRLKRIKYKKSELLALFKKYNTCRNSEFVSYVNEKSKKDLFRLTIRPGVRSSSLALRNSIYSAWDNVDFGKNLTSFRLGLEAEFVMGFNNNKWAILLEPTYHQFNSDKNTGDVVLASINQRSIEVNLGIRHYMYLNKDLKLFANALFIYVNNFNSQIEEGRFGLSTELVNTLNGALGIGCTYKERFSLEFRHLPNRNILYTHIDWSTDFQSLSVVLGYSIF